MNFDEIVKKYLGETIKITFDDNQEIIGIMSGYENEFDSERGEPVLFIDSTDYDYEILLSEIKKIEKI